MQAWRNDDPSWWDEGVLLMAVDLGFDEGGADDTLLVSVQMAVTEQAKKLKRHWRSALGPLPFFHSKDLWNFSHGVFTEAGFDRQQRERLLQTLRKIIHRHLQLGITARVHKSLYDSLTDKTFRSRWGTAYSFAINILIACARLEFETPGVPTKINVLIESGHRHSAQALEIVNDAKNLPLGERFVTVLTAGLGSKINNPILQAADMLAYTEWQGICERPCPLDDVMFSETSNYRTARVDCTEELIREVIRGPLEWMERKRQYWHTKRKTICH